MKTWAQAGHVSTATATEAGRAGGVIPGAMGSWPCCPSSWARLRVAQPSTDHSAAGSVQGPGWSPGIPHGVPEPPTHGVGVPAAPRPPGSPRFSHFRVSTRGGRRGYRGPQLSGLSALLWPQNCRRMSAAVYTACLRSPAEGDSGPQCPGDTSGVGGQGGGRILGELSPSRRTGCLSGNPGRDVPGTGTSGSPEAGLGSPEGACGQLSEDGREMVRQGPGCPHEDLPGEGGPRDHLAVWQRHRVGLLHTPAGLTHARTHTHTHMHAYMHTRTHTRAHAPAPASSKDGECHKVETALERTEEPGRYSVHGGLSSLRIEASAVRAHRVLSYEGRLSGAVFRVTKLLGRNPDPNPEALGEFKEFTERQGLPRESIVTPAQADNCVPRREEGEQPWK
ncbi:uncharacterized protein [Oryctolagus cuniculus]|uniref:uncharacterized protein n=1 Tax=Oryctolagus cuniculus TaxID=9986 RepID=UPI0038797C24